MQPSKFTEAELQKNLLKGSGNPITGLSMAGYEFDCCAEYAKQLFKEYLSNFGKKAFLMIFFSSYPIKDCFELVCNEAGFSVDAITDSCYIITSNYQ